MNVPVTDGLDFFSLDVEGGELFVLQTMDWDIPVGVWLVELDGSDPAKDEGVRKLLNEHGYVASAVNPAAYCGWAKGHSGCTQNSLFVKA